MSNARLKGQEVALVFVENNAPLVEVTDVRSFEMSAQLEILKEGYLGETTDRKDSVYRGYSGKVDVHLEGRDAVDLVRRLIDKARRRTPGTRVNLKVTLEFADDRVRMVLKDLQFGEIPMTAAGRTEYVTLSLPFEGEDYQVIG